MTLRGLSGSFVSSIDRRQVGRILGGVDRQRVERRRRLAFRHQRLLLLRTHRAIERDALQSVAIDIGQRRVPPTSSLSAGRSVSALASDLQLRLGRLATTSARPGANSTNASSSP